MSGQKPLVAGQRAGYGFVGVPVPRRPRMKICWLSAPSARLKVDSPSRSLRDWLVWLSTRAKAARPIPSMTPIRIIAVTSTLPRSSFRVLVQHVTVPPGMQTVCGRRGTRQVRLVLDRQIDRVGCRVPAGRRRRRCPRRCASGRPRAGRRCARRRTRSSRAPAPRDPAESDPFRMIEVPSRTAVKLAAGTRFWLRRKTVEKRLTSAGARCGVDVDLDARVDLRRAQRVRFVVGEQRPGAIDHLLPDDLVGVPTGCRGSSVAAG